YDMVKAFADELGVSLLIYSVPSFAEVRRHIASGRAHIAAAGLTVRNDWGRSVTFGPAYQQVRQHLIYVQGGLKPRGLEEINGSNLHVAAGSAQAQALRRARAQQPDQLGDLAWVERQANALELLEE